MREDDDGLWEWIFVAAVILYFLSGCARPYYSGTPSQHLGEIPCDADNCGRPPR